MADKECPKCGETEGWYPAGDLMPPDKDTGMMDVVMRDHGGHCLRCDFDSDDPPAQHKEP